MISKTLQITNSKLRSGRHFT